MCTFHCVNYTPNKILSKQKQLSAYLRNLLSPLLFFKKNIYVYIKNESSKAPFSGENFEN